MGVAPVAGVMLAVLVSILVFQLARISAAERESITQVRTAADKLYELLRSNIPLFFTYFEGVNDFEGFRHRITLLSRLHSVERVPDYITWRTHTAEILMLSVRNADRFNQAEDISEGEDRFHTDFVDLMSELDAGIQHNHASVIVPRRVAGLVKVAVSLTSFLLLISISTALAAELRYGEGIPDYWNLALAALSISLIMFLVILLGALVFEVGSSSGKAIDAAAERHIKRLRNLQKPKNPSPVARVWRFIRPPTL